MDEKSSGGSFVIGFLIGAIAGAAAALLLTPQSGEDMRRTIGQKERRAEGWGLRQAQRLATDAKGQVEYVQEKGRVVISENVRKAQDIVTGKPAGEAPPATPGRLSASPICYDQAESLTRAFSFAKMVRRCRSAGHTRIGRQLCSAGIGPRLQLVESFRKKRKQLTSRDASRSLCHAGHHARQAMHKSACDRRRNGSRPCATMATMAPANTSPLPALASAGSANGSTDARPSGCATTV